MRIVSWREAPLWSIQWESRSRKFWSTLSSMFASVGKSSTNIAAHPRLETKNFFWIQWAIRFRINITYRSLTHYIACSLLFKINKIFFGWVIYTLRKCRHYLSTVLYKFCGVEFINKQQKMTVRQFFHFLKINLSSVSISSCFEYT